MAKIQGVHIPAEFRNLAINGALDFWQRVGSAVTTVNTSSTQAFFTADMVKTDSGGSTTKNYSVARSTDVPSLAQSGFNSTYSFLFTMLTGIASPASGDYVIPFDTRMEGQDYERIHTKNVTFGFWVKASVAGTYSFALQNGSQNRSYVTTFAISGSNAWQYQTIPVTLDSSGTWNFDNTIGLIILIGGVTGSSLSTATLGSWQTGNFLAASTGTNWQATTNATFQIAQLSITEGSLGLGSTGFIRNGNSYQQELANCQRYCYAVPTGNGVPICHAGMQNGNTAAGNKVAFPVTMRANPTMVSSAATTFQAAQPGVGIGQGSSITQDTGRTSTSIGYFNLGIGAGFTNAAPVWVEILTGGTMYWDSGL